MTPSPDRVLVVGGGIAGLAAAWELVKAGADVVVHEAGDRLGGKIRTTSFAGNPVDEGADAFLARVPAAVELAREVGLGDDLTSPATGQASLWIDGALKPIPAGHVLGVPVDVDVVARSGILTPDGVARARQEPDLPGEPLGADEDVAIGELVTRRFGREVHERLVDPLLGGINAGRTEELSIEVGAAQLAAAARRDASLTRALLAMRAENPPDPTVPVFYAPRGGMQRLVDALAAALVERGVEIRLNSPVDAIDRGQRAVVAAPAFVAASLLAPRSEKAAKLLAEVEYASVALVTLAYRRPDLGGELRGSGFLVPRTQGRALTAASIFSNKWPALDDPELVIVRASFGRHGTDEALRTDDGDLTAMAMEELKHAFGMDARPVERRVSRWERAFPQFRPGHLARMAEVDAALAADAPGVAVAGAAIRGVGIPTCILSAKAAAARVLQA